MSSNLKLVINVKINDIETQKVGILSTKVKFVWINVWIKI